MATPPCCFSLLQFFASNLFPRFLKRLAEHVPVPPAVDPRGAFLPEVHARVGIPPAGPDDPVAGRLPEHAVLAAGNVQDGIFPRHRAHSFYARETQRHIRSIPQAPPPKKPGRSSALNLLRRGFPILGKRGRESFQCLEHGSLFFPMFGKIAGVFSNHWKILRHHEHAEA